MRRSFRPNKNVSAEDTYLHTKTHRRGAKLEARSDHLHLHYSIAFSCAKVNTIWSHVVQLVVFSYGHGFMKLLVYFFLHALAGLCKIKFYSAVIPYLTLSYFSPVSTFDASILTNISQIIL